jgi:hypothetical protein
VRDAALHEVIKAFTEDAAAALASEQAGGAEVPFEVVEAIEGRQGSPPLYCYRALTGEFIQRRMGLLSGLTSYAPAARALASRERSGSYLTLRGIARVPEDPRELADAILLALLRQLFSERSDFQLEPERFEAAYAELEQALLDGRATAMVIVPLLGLALEERTWQIELGEGLSLVRGDRLDGAPPEAVWEGGTQPHVLAVLSVTQERSAPAPLGEARERFRHLESSIRLFERGSFGLAALGWARLDFGPWRPVWIGGREATTGEAGTRAKRTVVSSRHEDELRGFCNLMARRLSAVRAGSFGTPELTWALARFQMGCDRVVALEGLSDHLLALRALLEPEGPSASRLPQRLALLCARPEERGVLAERVAQAVSLERAAVMGMASGDADEEELVQEMVGHLRALLRDVLCGHLDANLVGVADALVAEELAASEPAPPQKPRPSKPRASKPRAGKARASTARAGSRARGVSRAGGASRATGASDAPPVSEADSDSEAAPATEELPNTEELQITAPA